MNEFVMVLARALVEGSIVVVCEELGDGLVALSRELEALVDESDVVFCRTVPTEESTLLVV